MTPLMLCAVLLGAGVPRPIDGVLTLETTAGHAGAWPQRTAAREIGSPLEIAVPARTAVDLLSVPADPTPAGRTHRLRVRSSGARSLSLAFETYRLPRGATLEIVGPDGRRTTFDAGDATGGGELWTPIVSGDVLDLALHVPHSVAFSPEVVLTRVHHGVVDLGGAQGDRPVESGGAREGACQVDAACVDDLHLEAPIRSVALYTVQGTTLCTGQLVDSATDIPRSYFLTADHCGVNATNAHTVRIYWDVASPSCGVRCCGDRSLSQVGTIVRARHAATDMCLLELTEPPPAGSGAFLSGWDAREAHTPVATTGIHHPSGGEKAVSHDADPPTPGSYLVDASPGDGTHWRIGSWEQGTTEPGSSGSGLWDESGRLVGQLHGGYAECGNALADWYGRLARSWEGGGSAATRLRDWLDPLGRSDRVHDGRSLRQLADDSGVVAATPVAAHLGAPSPNPMRSFTSLVVDVVLPGEVALDLFDAAGRRVASLPARRVERGTVTFTWDGLGAGDRPVAPGVYIVRLAHEGRATSGRKLVVLGE